MFPRHFWENIYALLTPGGIYISWSNGIRQDFPAAGDAGKGKENGMYEIFGEMDSAEEINRTAEGLKNEGDRENLYRLAEENGIDGAFVDMYLDGTADNLCCDAATAAIGKVEAEEKELKPVEIVADWTEYIKTLCSDDEAFSRAVRGKGKSLKGCIAALLKWSFGAKYDVDRDIVQAAGINATSVKMGIPGMGTAKRLIREYYFGKGGGRK